MRGNCTLSIFPRVQEGLGKPESETSSLLVKHTPGEQQARSRLLTDVTRDRETHGMKHNFQRGTTSSWWACWKSAKTFPQASHFRYGLWETFIGTLQVSPLDVHWGAQQTLLTPWLREGPIITLISCREERESKAARIIETKWKSVFERKRNSPTWSCPFTHISARQHWLRPLETDVPTLAGKALLLWQSM